jgi:hypothetical protein
MVLNRLQLHGRQIPTLIVLEYPGADLPDVASSSAQASRAYSAHFGAHASDACYKQVIAPDVKLRGKYP